MNKDIENLKAIVEDLEDTDNGAMINLSQEEIESLKAVLKLIKKQEKEIKGKDAWIDTLEHNDKVYQELIKEYEKDFISKDKIRELQDKYKNKLERLESKKIWNEPIDTINKNRYTNYFNAYEELLKGE